MNELPFAHMGRKEYWAISCVVLFFSLHIFSHLFAVANDASENWISINSPTDIPSRHMTMETY